MSDASFSFVGDMSKMKQTAAISATKLSKDLCFRDLGSRLFLLLLSSVCFSEFVPFHFIGNSCCHYSHRAELSSF